MVSRREFILTSGAALAAAMFQRGRMPFKPSAAAMLFARKSQTRRSRQAAKLGASYADIRVNRYRRESIATREQQVQNVSRSTSYGFGVRVLVNGAWGFAAANLG